MLYRLYTETQIHTSAQFYEVLAQKCVPVLKTTWFRTIGICHSDTLLRLTIGSAHLSGRGKLLASLECGHRDIVLKER